MSVIGDTQSKAVQPVVAALPLGVVTQAEVAAKANAVNIALYSGKKLGATYLVINTDGSYDIIVAKDALPTSPWVRISDGTSLTPA